MQICYKEAQKLFVLPAHVFRAPIGAMGFSFADAFLCLFVATKFCRL